MDSLFLVAQGQQPSPITFILPWVLIFVVFYLLVFRPAGKRRKAQEQLRENLKKGDRVVTGGGIYGEVVKTQDNVVVLKLADNVRIRVAKWAIAGLEGSPEDKGGQ